MVNQSAMEASLLARSTESQANSHDRQTTDVEKNSDSIIMKVFGVVLSLASPGHSQ